MERQIIRGGIAADEAYWDFLDQGEFRLPRCADCKRWMWPANFRCGECGSWEQEWVEREKAGTVYSWTRTWYPFEHVEARAEDLPYSVALVEVPDSGGARVIGVVQGDETGLHVGARVAGTILPPSEKTLGYSSIVWEVVP
jgi:uncharacterized OB-fold protein